MVIKEKGFYKGFFRLLILIALQNVIVLGVNLADNIMIGSYSEAALSGVAAINQIQFIYQQLVIGIGDAMVVLASQYWGTKNVSPIRKIASGAYLTAFLLGVFLFVLCSVFPTQIVSCFTSYPDIIREGVSYLEIIKYSYLTFALTSALLAMMRSVEVVNIAFYISLSTLVINCSINYLLIGGNLGAPEMGVRGAAIGTLTARIVEFLIAFIYVIFVDKRIKFKFRDFFVLKKLYVYDYIKAYIPFFITGIIFGGSTALQTVILGHMSESAIAANSASNALYQVLKVIIISSASASAVYIGKTIGEGNIPKVKNLTHTFQIIFVCLGIITSLLLFLLRMPILNLYSLSEETRKLAESFILVLCVTCIGTSYQMPVSCGIIRGGGDPKFVMYNDFVSLWLIVLPISFMGAFVWNWHPTVVVACLNSDQIFKCLAASIKVNRYKWIKKLTR